jgi:hypothetical protein
MCLLRYMAIVKKENLVGLTFGRLTVVEEMPPKEPNKRGKRPSWKCMCSCGDPEPVVIRDGSKLKSGNSKSCGCLKKEKAAKRMSDWQATGAGRTYEPRIASAMGVFRAKYTDGDLQFDDFYSLSQLPCFYCNQEPSNVREIVFPNSSAFYAQNCRFVYNGLDRVNNDLPHSKDNCVPCCKECNLSKRNMTITDFLWMVEHIYLNRHNVLPDLEIVYATSDCDLSHFRRIKGKVFTSNYHDIDFDRNLFHFILTLDCFYCGREPSNNVKCKNGDIIKTNGLDRLDQTKGHSLDNIVPCCKFCNWSKAKRSREGFIAWAIRVYEFYGSRNSSCFDAT